MNIIEIKTEEQLEEVLPVLQQLRTTLTKRGSTGFISPDERRTLSAIFFNERKW